MKNSGISAFLIFNKEDLNYYSGYRVTWEFALLHGLVLTRGGKTAAVTPQIGHMFGERYSYIDEIVPFGGAPHWGLKQDPVETLVSIIVNLGLAESTIGLELGPVIYVDITLEDFERLKQKLPRAKFVNVMDFIWSQRVVKTEWEVGVIRKLADITVKGFEAGIRASHSGVTERSILKTIWQKFIEEGAFDAPMRGQLLFRGGMKEYDMSCTRPIDAVLKKGANLYFDGGPCYMGYYADIQRHVCVGEPSDLQKRLYDISLVGQEAAESAIKPGNTFSDVHYAAMSVVSKVPDDLRKKGVEYLYPHTFMGHSIGLLIHEPPYITAWESTKLVPGMVFCLEVPSLDIPQYRVLGGYPEELYLVTPNGFENLTGTLPRNMHVVD
jgi:Xaa-Pro dipeptidase